MSSTESPEITVQFDGKRCIHARRCVLGLPQVFRAGAKGQWIFPDQASADQIARIIDTCPSGALTYDAKGATEDEMTPPVNTLRPWENGPNELRGDLRIAGQDARERAVLCRCGASKSMPFCDNSHRDADFTATSEIPSKPEPKTLEDRGGPLEVTPTKDGPNKVTGNLEIIAGSGRKVDAVTKVFLCRCGHSQNKPFCDGSHKDAGFKAEGA